MMQWTETAGDLTRFRLLITNSGTTDIHVGTLRVNFKKGVETGRQAAFAGSGFQSRSLDTRHIIAG